MLKYQKQGLCILFSPPGQMSSRSCGWSTPGASPMPGGWGGERTPRFLCRSLSSFPLPATSQYLADSAHRGQSHPRLTTDGNSRCTAVCGKQGELHSQTPDSRHCQAHAHNCMQSSDVAGTSLSQKAGGASQLKLPRSAGPS